MGVSNPHYRRCNHKAMFNAPCWSVVSLLPRGIFAPRRPGPHPRLVPRPALCRASGGFGNFSVRNGRGAALGERHRPELSPRAGKKMEKGGGLEIAAAAASIRAAVVRSMAGASIPAATVSMASIRGRRHSIRRCPRRSRAPPPLLEESRRTTAGEGEGGRGRGKGYGKGGVGPNICL